MVRFGRRAADVLCPLLLLSSASLFVFLVGGGTRLFRLFADWPLFGGALVVKTNSSESVVWPQVVLFGDSLTELSFSPDGGWGAVLADRLKRRCDVLPRGFAGFNTRRYRTFLPAVFGGLDAERIRVATVLLGTNDAKDPETQLERLHVPLDEYVENLTWIVQYLLNRGLDKSNVILITPPKCDGERLGEPSRDEVTRNYARACAQVAEKFGCDYVDMYHLMETNYRDSWKSLLIDGLHFSAQGHRVIADAVWKLIEPRVGHLPFLFLVANDA